MGAHERGAEFEKPDDEKATAKGVSRRILIVEDDEDSAAVLAEFLQIKGHWVHAVHDGVMALEAARQHPVDVVLLDLGLPKMDGYEVARALRREHGDDIFLIALTGYQEDANRLNEAGFDEHLLKPFDVELLSKRLTASE
jgi:two-component system, chemotaxis family, CheB/CheR fusion protein